MFMQYIRSIIGYPGRMTFLDVITLSLTLTALANFKLQSQLEESSLQLIFVNDPWHVERLRDRRIIDKTVANRLESYGSFNKKKSKLNMKDLDKYLQHVPLPIGDNIELVMFRGKRCAQIPNKTGASQVLAARYSQFRNTSSKSYLFAIFAKN
ncbi:hypothetical protein GQX74_012519 [Glossina fuscipes]|nr:hypothetical protein GQX74_012519 [Glossina fuscipes]